MSVEPLPSEDSKELEEVELTVRMPTDMVAALKVAAFQRRSLGEPDLPLSDLVCEAVSRWLESEMDNTTSVVIEV